MNTVVFSGPTLAPHIVAALAPKLAGGEFRGPARCGDVFRAVEQGFARIALIDGVFDQSLAVWHKEILWAIHRGCTVFGAASMGALRAAELHSFGMVGIGRIFEAYRDGLLLDDDEVAVAHAGPDDGYRPLSAALVNIRVTLQSAVAAGVLPREGAQRLIALCQARFYPERHLSQLLADAAATPDGGVDLSALREWLGPTFERFVDQKSADALLLLQTLSAGDPARQPVKPARARFAFSYTEAFRELVRRHQPVEHEPRLKRDSE